MRLIQGNQKGDSDSAMGPDPLYNRSPIKFEVRDPRAPLVVQAIDVQRQAPILEAEVPLDRIGSEVFPEYQDIVVPPSANDNDYSPRLVLRLDYFVNNANSIRGKIALLENHIKDDVNIINQVRSFIQQLESPFGFLSRLV